MRYTFILLIHFRTYSSLFLLGPSLSLLTTSADWACRRRYTALASVAPCTDDRGEPGLSNGSRAASVSWTRMASVDRRVRESCMLARFGLKRRRMRERVRC